MLKASDHPEPTLQTTALRYAAGDLNPNESAEFELLLADDQAARDALSEAVRLSAAALGQAPPTPHHTFRAAIRDRLSGWCPSWLRRGAYRGHPLVWSSLGAAVVFACTIVGLSFDTEPEPAAKTPVAVSTPAPHAPSAVAAEVAPAPRETETFAAVSTGSAACGESATHTPTVSIAELWAELSTPEHAEKTHDEELRWRHRHHAASLHNGRGHASDSPREP
ncbi:MAG: hypothetical protein U0792_07060 [Gemmataceae bacterium]